jgi:hypothetical protein
LAVREIYRTLMIAAVGGVVALALLNGVGASKGAEEMYAPVLAPEQFGGEASMGYAAAAAVPKVCAKLFCYCGCDSTDNHTNLLDCFTSTHGSDCHICQEEALMALRMQKEGKSLKEIQKSVDDTYSHMYPFRNPTAALKNYRAHKLYAGEPDGMHDMHGGTHAMVPGTSCCGGHSN